jgi:hypothetical protein
MRTAALFVDHAFELSGVMTKAFAQLPGLPERKSTAAGDRERFEQRGRKVIEEMRLLVLELGETRGKWRFLK